MVNFRAGCAIASNRPGGDRFVDEGMAGWGRVRPTDITKAAVPVTQTSQCPVLIALRTARIEQPSSPLADDRTDAVSEAAGTWADPPSHCVGQWQTDC